MTLATHGAIGAIIASKFPENPVLGFCLAFAVHFIMDAIPHWDYPMNSVVKDEKDFANSEMVLDKRFLFDLLKSGTDFFIGLTVSLVMLASSWSLVSLVPILAGVAGGVLPDFLQFVYFQIKKEPLTSLEHFHVWIHTKNRMKGLAFLSFASQAVLVLTVFCISRYF